MTKVRKKTAIDLVVDELREIVLGMEDGGFVDSENGLVARLGCSRSTVRQVARLLEREGLLTVRRGSNGGYFAARPDANTIEATVGTYLSTLDIEAQDVTTLASALWVEAMRKAVTADPEEAEALAILLKTRIRAVKDNASFQVVRDLELETQDAIFNLTRSGYVKLIFDINAEFSRRRFHQPMEDDGSAEHLRFVRTWREAKLMELTAILERDRDLAVMAARYSRNVWHRRVYSRLIALPSQKSMAA